MPSSSLLVSRSDRVAVFTMNRPRKRNALDPELVAALTEAFEAASGDDAVRTVVLTGAGAAFSAGADLAGLQALQTASAEENLADSLALARLFSLIYTFPKPTIARINGHALAGGCGLAAACDFSVASETALLGFPEVRVGFVPALVSVLLVRKLGEGRARPLLLRGHRITAADGVRIGLITKAVPADGLDAAVDALAREVSVETSPVAVALTKKLLSSLGGLEEGLAHAAMVNALARSTEDCRAGVSAFLAKTDPPWR